MAESLSALMGAGELSDESQAKSIERALAWIGRSLDVHRVVIVEHAVHDDALTMRVVHEWAADGIRAATEVWTGRQASTPAGRAMIDALHRGETVETDRDRVPPETRERLQQAGVVSSISVPISIEGHCWGQLGLVDGARSRDWNDAERAALRAFAAAYGVSLLRRRAFEGAGRQASRLEALSALVSDPTSSPQAQIDAILELATRELGLDRAVVQRVDDPDADEALVVHAWTTDGAVVPGQMLPIDKVEWKELVKRGMPHVVENFLQTPLADHFVVQERGLRSFIGAAVWVGNRPYGSTAFIGLTPQTFSTADRDFVSLIAQWVGSMIERENAEKERQRLEDQLRATERLQRLGVAVGGLAHDFNNLLLVTDANLDLAKAEIAAGRAEDCIELIERAQEASRQAAELTRQMLVFAGRGRTQMETFDLNQLVLDMQDLLRSILPNNAEISLDLAAELPPVTADPTCVRQILMNLLTNAVEAMHGKPGQVWTRTRLREIGDRPTAVFVSEGASSGTYVELEVEDEGSGIDEADLSRVLEPFFTTKPWGRGLGLASVVGIVRSHRGALDIRSVPGRGTIMRVLLPTAQQTSSSNNEP